MGDAMLHRGPDDSGVWVEEQAASRSRTGA
jgi:asparagine synthetase B (glutamine-hydrolysing)